MSHKYTPEFKARVVLEVLRGDWELGEIAAENGLDPDTVRTWKEEFIKNACRVFNERRSNKDIRKREAEIEKERAGLQKTVDQLTLERDFLRDVFHQSGYPVPKRDKSDR